MINGVGIQGVKSFVTAGHIPCRGVTVLTGANSCGKSTVFQSLLLLKQLAEAGYRASTTVGLDGSHVALGSYPDWASERRSEPMSVGVGWSLPNSRTLDLKVTLEPAEAGRPADARLVEVEWVAGQDDDESRAALRTKLLSAAEIATQLRTVLEGAAGTSVADDSDWSEDHPYTLSLEVDRADEELLRLQAAASVSGLQPIEVAREGKDVLSYPEWLAAVPTGRAPDVMAALATANESSLLNALHHLGPLRDEPKLIYANGRAKQPWDVGVRGERSAVALAEFGDEVVESPDPELTGTSRPRSLVEAVAEWAQAIGVAHGVTATTRTKYGTALEIEAAYNAEGGVSGGSFSADVLNVGTGVSQVLPVLVQCLAAPMGSTVLLEQPELHLHPAVQSRLADFLAACSKSGRQVIIETHSEHLVNRLRLHVARGFLDPSEDVSLVFIERDRFGSTAERIALRADGSLERWPRGFFDETQESLKQLLAERVK